MTYQNDDLSNASKYGNIIRAKKLLEEGADPSANKFRATRLACKHGHIPMLELLLSECHDIPYKDLIEWSCHGGQIEPIKYLQKTCYIDLKNESKLLKYAISSGNNDLLKFLVDENNINPKNDSSALSYAIKNRELDMVNYLLEKGSDPMADDYLAFHSATLSGSDKLIKALIDWCSINSLYNTESVTPIERIINPKYKLYFKKSLLGRLTPPTIENNSDEISL